MIESPTDASTEIDLSRLAGVAGCIGLPLAGIGVLLDEMWQFPATSATGPQIAAFFADHRTECLIAMFLNSIAVALWFLFGAGVYQRLWNAKGGTVRPLAVTFAIGLTGFVTLLLTGFTCAFLLIDQSPPPEQARLLYNLTFALLAISGLPTALSLTAYTASVRRTGCFPAWTANWALLAAITHVALVGSLIARTGPLSVDSPTITIAIPAVLITWIAATGITLAYSHPPKAQPDI